jgi:hypothetical protein
MSNRYLPTALRRAIEKAVKDGRVVAEQGSQDAIRRLGVADSKAPSYLTDAEKELRRRLRAHARALGDVFDRTTDAQQTKRLIEAAAYAHWHRMLFARFLAERGLLRHPEHNVPVSLEDCRELAEAEGLSDAWAVAERYSAAMLPAVFRLDDPVLALDLDPVHTQKLNLLVTGLDAEVFQAEDSLGWTYQYWRAAEKDTINASGEKIGAAELPAVTQLFTEPYMVRFLLHNTLGAWWAGKLLATNPNLAVTASNEDALRDACALPGYSFDMLRFMRKDEDGPWTPSAGTFLGWPMEAKALTMLDPCCGSGHFLTEALRILAALRHVEEGMSSNDAVAAVLRENVYGLEIDGRCVQIAAFAVALTAWRTGGWQSLPIPHIAWVGAPPPLPKADFIALANGDADLGTGLAALYELFAQAPYLGSLIEPEGGDLGDKWRLGNLEPLLKMLLNKARKAEPEAVEGTIAARGMADAAQLLSQRYTLQATNVPFLGRGKMESALAAFCERFHNEAKADLSTVMLSRMDALAEPGGTIAAVTPQNWLHLGSYKAFRKNLIKSVSLNSVVDLGPAAFRDMNWWAARTTLISYSNSKDVKNNAFFGLDADTARDLDSKPGKLRSGDILVIDQEAQRKNPDCRIVLSTEISSSLLSEFADYGKGSTTGDGPRFILNFWELPHSKKKYERWLNSPEVEASWGGRRTFLKCSPDHPDLTQQLGCRIHGQNNWNKRGFAINKMRNLFAFGYDGELFDDNVATIVPKNPTDLPAIGLFLTNEQYRNEVRKIDKKVSVTAATLTKVGFDIGHWRALGEQSDASGFGDPHSSDPTQWLFHGHPANANKGTALHVALARFCGYRWPVETDRNIRISVEARDWTIKAAALPVANNDGLFGIPAVAGDKSLTDRFRTYLAAVFGSGWSDALERRLTVEADEMFDKKIARDNSLDAWLRDRAFRQHSVLFNQCPFLWHIWDGLKDGFSVFAHYHRFDQAGLRKLTYTMLGDWLARAKAEGNALRFEKGRELQQMLEKLLEGESPYDIFVRWKSLAQQPLGWDPDLEDGVRQNIRPFIEAGVLTYDLSRVLKDKDRGNDVTSAPWYSVFKGERINNHHTTLAEKQASREAVRQRVQAK